jgi:hypothetical protein
MLIGLVLLSTLAVPGPGATYAGLPGGAFLRGWLLLSPNSKSRS